MSLEGKQCEVKLTEGSSTTGEIKADRPKAVLIDFYGLEKWLPKSQVKIKKQLGGGVRVEPVDWLAEEIEQELGEVG